MVARICIDTRSKGSQIIYHTFENIRYLSEYSKRYSPSFSLCNSNWKLGIRKQRDVDNVPYLVMYLNKLDDSYENQFSYHVQFKITLLAFEGHENKSFDIQEGCPNSRYMFGKRPGESMGWGSFSFILWNDLLDPDSGFLDAGNGIQVELDMSIVNIYGHRNNCQCRAC